MSVEQHKVRMPQPEQWLSEHPGVELLILVGFCALLALLIKFA